MPKHPVQLMQEAAGILMLGGGFQVYIPQNRDGSPKMDWIRALKPVADFIRSRAPYCFGGRLRRELAVLLPVSNQYRQNTKPFAIDGQESTGCLLNLLCDAGYSTCVVTEADLSPERVRDFSVIVVPQLFCPLPKSSMDRLTAWTKDGGSLLLTGINTCRFFAEAGYPTALADDFVRHQRCFTLDGRTSGAFQRTCSLKDDGGDVVARTTEKHLPFAAVRTFGKGRVAVVGADVGNSYEQSGQYLQRKLVASLLDNLQGVSAKVESAVGLVEIAQLEKGGKELLQLVNANGHHHNLKVYTADVISPAIDVRSALRRRTCPKELVLQPTGERLAFEWKDGVVRVTVPRVDLHEILEIR